jgi:beta-galactosidase
MIVLISVTIITVWLPAVRAAYIPPFSRRVDIVLNSNWKFYRDDVSGAEDIKFNDSDWTTINLPHTWNNIDGQDGGNNYYRGIGWYRKHFVIDNTYTGRNIYLKFDGANSTTEVYVNGKKIGQHSGGYSAFCFDITARVKIGADNLIAVMVDNSGDTEVLPLSADFTFFGGIYRGVHLLVTDKLSVTPLDYASPGVYLKPTKVSSTAANLQITAKIKNNYDVSKKVTVKTTIVDAAGKIIKTLTANQLVGAGAGYDFVQNTTISKPHLWNGLSDPYLYRAYVEVMDGSAVVDLVEQPLGFRYFNVDSNQGFYLNGKYLDLHGVNRHQDRLDKGWAIGPAEHLEDFNLIKEMGCTAIRLAHYQHAGYFYQLCDSGGMIVWAEIPLVNRVTNSDGFHDNAKRQLTELIRQNYNHPSIFFWGIGNEIESSPNPNQLLAKLNDLAHTEDPARLTTYASNVTEAEQSWHTDVNGFNRYDGWYGNTYNDFPRWADTTHEGHPDNKIGVSEYGAGSGINIHTVSPARMDHSEEYQCAFHEAYWREMRTRPFIWGKFIWNMFDFAVDGRDEGDTPGRNDKGMITYDRKTKKDVFFYYKANWSNTPVLYITGRRFINRSSEDTEVKIYSNCDPVQLKINGVSRKAVKGSPDRVFLWTGVKLAAGRNTIEAVGTKNGAQYTDSCTWTYIPKVVPGKIEAENYDAMSGVQTQKCSEETLNVGWIDSDDWMDYKVKVNTTATYTVQYRVASPNNTGEIQLRVDSKILAVTAIPNTGGWQNWDTVTADIQLEAGLQTLRIYATGDGFNLNWIEFSINKSPALAKGTPTPIPVLMNWISKGKPSGASSFQSGNEVFKANDGDSSTRWAAASGSYPQWWKVDLGAATNIVKVNISWYKGNERAYKYKIEVSKDDKIYEAVVDKTNNSANGNTSDGFTANARYVRITVTGCSQGAAWASALEIKIYSK